MYNSPSGSKTKQNNGFEDDIFDNSSFMAHFDNSFKETSNVSASNLNDSRNALNVSALCCDEELSGYDKLTGKTWIYPTNYPVRDYQFNIIRAALVKNTLVSLPTGLGKTFIAAVIMYNFYRWYPLGKIIFTAPTRPLVAQQIEACYNIIAIPPSDTIEMTGHMQVKTRKDHWQSKRVFFATPQVIYNDMKSGICPCEKIRCLVIDEAHKARGNYAYCQIVSTLDDMGHKLYRLLALSATPGSKVDDVINVVKNLHIAHLELRTDNCIDVAPYSHARKINTVVIQLSQQLNTLRQQYVEILDAYARRLKQLNILPYHIGNMSKGRIVMLYKEFQNKERGARHPQHNSIMKDFTLLITLYHGLELLVQHGSRVFLNFFDEHPEKSWMQSDDRLTALLERLRDDLGINPLSLDRSILPDGTVPEMPNNLCFGHPKFDKLKEIMMNHFTKAERNKQDTRAIVFCEYRESVNLVHCLLLQCRPVIKPQMFVGQGASGKDGKTMVSQKQQLRVMRSFREGACNALVATCVAEEGLDVGSVDLILCFDISTKSPIRLVQRCGRTGRERGGQVYILVTEGREHQTLLDCMRQRDGLNRLILQSKDVENNLYKANPRMMPRDFTPQCQKMYITVEKKPDSKEKNKDGIDKTKKGQKDLRSMLLGRASTSKSSFPSRETDSGSLLTEIEFKELFPEGYSDTALLPAPKECWANSRDSFKHIQEPDESELKLTRWLEWQRTLQKTVNVTHSRDSEILSELLQYADAKRFEMPASTQNPCFSTQESPSKNVLSPQKLVLLSPAKGKQIKKTKKPPVMKSPAKKDGDIRALFSTATRSTKNYTKLINELGIQSDGGIPTRLVNLLVDLTLDNTTEVVKTCYICQNVCDCSSLLKLKNEKKPRTILSLKELKLPDIDLIDDFDAETVLQCAKSNVDKNVSIINDVNTQAILEDINIHESKHKIDDFDADTVWQWAKNEIDDYTIQENIKIETSKHIDDFEVETELITANKSNDIEDSVIDKKLNLSNNFDLELDFLGPNDTQSIIESPKKKDEPVNSDPFDVGNIEDIFADSSPEEAIVKETEVAEEPKEAKEVLNFFGLDSVEDIFADDEIDNTPPEITQINTKTTSKVENSKILKSPVAEPTVDYTYPVSPSILSGRIKVKEIPTSPILCSQVRKFQLSTKKDRTRSSTPLNSSCKKQLIKEPAYNNNVDDMKAESVTKYNISNNDTGNKSMFTLSQLEAMINKTDGNVSALTKSNISNDLVKENRKGTSPILLTQNERSSNQARQSVSPILLSQAEKKRSLVNFNNSDKSTQQTIQTKRNESLIILESDSDSDSTQVYDVNEEIIKKSKDYSVRRSPQVLKIVDPTSSKTFSPNKSKRKLDMDSSGSVIASPHFSKKPKLDTHDDEELTKDKKSATTFNLSKMNKHHRNDSTALNCVVYQSKYFSQKENRNPQILDDHDELQKDNSITKNNLSMLQMFRRDCKIDKHEISAILKESPTKAGCSQKRKLVFDDSDDEFVTDEKHKHRSPHKMNGDKCISTTNHKVRKKKKLHNSFLETEAALSDDNSASDDELTDDSVGSIAEFICDDSVIPQENMEAVYLKSVKSPIRAGAFKIPELPQRYNRDEILSQHVDEDTYEMDSFCVDSNIGLTQVNEVSELELAEMLLEEKRRAKKSRRICTQDESPDVKVKNKPKRRQIHSDSDDSD